MASCIKVQCIQLGSDNKLDNDKKNDHVTGLCIYYPMFVTFFLECSPSTYQKGYCKIVQPVTLAAASYIWVFSMFLG
jgi:hypothetical protein